MPSTKKTDDSPTAFITHSTHAGLKLPVNTVSAMVKLAANGCSAGKTACVAMTAVVEWVMTAVLIESKKRCALEGRKKITVDDMQQAVRLGVLKACFPGTIIAGCRPTSTLRDAGADSARKIKALEAKRKRKRAKEIKKIKARRKQAAIEKAKRLEEESSSSEGSDDSSSASSSSSSSKDSKDSKASGDSSDEDSSSSFSSADSSDEDDDGDKGKGKKRPRSSGASGASGGSRKKSRNR